MAMLTCLEAAVMHAAAGHAFTSTGAQKKSAPSGILAGLGLGAVPSRLEQARRSALEQGSNTDAGEAAKSTRELSSSVGVGDGEDLLVSMEGAQREAAMLKRRGEVLDATAEMQRRVAELQAEADAGKSELREVSCLALSPMLWIWHPHAGRSWRSRVERDRGG
eukprot:658050-Rhodomonas_salina.1